MSHKVGDLVMGVYGDDQRVLGVIKTKKLSTNEFTYQVEWANDVSCENWYKEMNVNAFKATYERYMRRNGV